MYPQLQIHYNAAWKIVGEIGMKSLTQDETNLKPGTLSMSFELSNDPGLGKNDPVALRILENSDDTGTVLFVGNVTDRSNDNQRTITIKCSNVIYDLENLVYETSTALGSDKYSPSHLTLFRDANVNPITAGNQIKLALDYALTQGVNINYVSADLDALDINMAATEAIDLTIAEVIDKSLAYRSDIIVAVEYTNPGDPQTIRFISRDKLSQTNLSISKNTTAFSAKARYDLQIDGVVLYYYWQDKDYDGTTSYYNQTDSAGQISGINVLKQTVQLQGEDKTQIFELPTYPLRDGTEDDSVVWAFWMAALRLTGVYTAAASVFQPAVDDDYYHSTGGDHIIAIDYYDSLSSDVKADIGTLYNPECHAAKVYYNKSEYENVSYFNNVYLQDHKPNNPYAVWLPCYSFILNKDIEFGLIDRDVIPEYLAQQLYDVLNPLQYDGNIVRLDDLRTPANICSILRKLNIADASDDLKTMNALVQKCRLNYLTRQQSLTFGPPDHLEPQDFISLTRQNRSRDFSIIFSKG